MTLLLDRQDIRRDAAEAVKEFYWGNSSKYYNGHPGVEVVRVLDSARSLTLALFNKYGDSYYAGYLFNAKSYKEHVTLTWRSYDTVSSPSPFDLAILWDGRRIVAISKIAPVYVEAGSTIKIDYPF